MNAALEKYNMKLYSGRAASAPPTMGRRKTPEHRPMSPSLVIGVSDPDNDCVRSSSLRRESARMRPLFMFERCSFMDGVHVLTLSIFERCVRRPPGTFVSDCRNLVIGVQISVMHTTQNKLFLQLA